MFKVALLLMVISEAMPPRVLVGELQRGFASMSACRAWALEHSTLR